jgi:hypothetical protein
MRANIALAAESLITTNSWLNNFDSWINAADWSNGSVTAPRSVPKARGGPR